MRQNLAGKRILVVGGTRGIGAGIARRTAEAGAHVVVASRSGGSGEHVAATRIDVTDEATIAAAAEALGGFDHVVSTASTHHDVPVPEVDRTRVHEALGAKVVGPLLLAKHFAPPMPDGGSFLFFSGIVGWRPRPGTVVKGTVNAALGALVTHVAVELAPLRVNAVAPGLLAGRAGSLDDVVDASLWLLGAGWVTGETIHVDGGGRHG